MAYRSELDFEIHYSRSLTLSIYIFIYPDRSLSLILFTYY